MLKEKQRLTLNNEMELGESISDEAKGKGRKFVSRFIEAGVAHYEEFGDVLITKETLNNFIETMVGCPVIIKHKDIDDKNADKERVGVVSKVWFNEYDGWYYCEGIIWDKQAIDLIKNQGWNVSCTYDFETDGLTKTHNGKKIDMEFTGGEFLHLALVPNPRYERANIVMNSKDKDDNDGRWVTIKGTHVFIPDGKEVEDVMREKGWEEKGEKKEGTKEEGKEKSENKEYKEGDIITFDSNWRGINPRISKGEITGKESKIATHGDTNPDYQYKVKLEDGRTILVEKEAIQERKDKPSESKEDKHGFKKDKDSGYYMKDLSDGTSVYVEKKEGGQGEKEPFYLEATHFDKDGKEIAKKQYHYDSMDGMFSKIDRDFSSKDKPDTKKKDKNEEDNIALKYYKQQVSKKLRKLETPEEQQKYIDDLEKKLEDHSDDANFVEVVKWAKENYLNDKSADYKEKGKSSNNIEELTMTVFNDLTEFIKNVVNGKENDMAVENEDKRKVIDEIGGMLKDKVDEEVWRTIIGKLEKLSYEPSEDKKADNKSKNAEDGKKEEKFEKEKEIAENKCKSKNEEDKEKKKVEDKKEEDKKEVKNSMDDVKKLVMGGSTEPQKTYLSKEDRFALGEQY